MRIFAESGGGNARLNAVPCASGTLKGRGVAAGNIKIDTDNNEYWRAYAHEQCLMRIRIGVLAENVKMFVSDLKLSETTRAMCNNKIDNDDDDNSNNHNKKHWPAG